MGAEIIAFKPKNAAAVETESGVDPLMRILTAAGDETDDVQTRYQRALPLAREFVEAWINEPDALVDFLAWAHARGALKF